MDDIRKLQARDPAVASVLRKTTSPSGAQERGKREEGGTTPMRSELTGIASSRIRTIKNSQRIFQALPELETIVTVSVSSLLSSKDLVNTSLIYDCVSDVPLDLKEELLGEIKDYHDNYRNLPRKLYKWMYDAQKYKGAAPILLLPDSGFDQLFGLDTRVAQESIKKRRSAFFTEQQGVLGKLSDSTKQKVGIESILAGRERPLEPQTLAIPLSGAGGIFNDGHEESTLNLTLTDNCRVLLMSDAVRRVARENARSSLYGQLEQAAYEVPVTPTGSGTFNPSQVHEKDEGVRGHINLGDLSEAYRKTPDAMPYAELSKPSLSDKNAIEYIEKQLSPESLLPLILGDDVMNPIGYLAILDDLGNPVSGRSSLYGDANFMNYLNNDGMVDSVINRAAIGMGEGTKKMTPDIANRLISRFGEIAESQIALAMGDALGGAELDLKVTETFGKILLSRHLAKRHTQVLYIPAENLCYFATDFDEDGFGVSITERSFVISTVRMALLFATMNSSILNSARHMQYDITLSPDAMNGEETVARIKSDILNSYNRRQPMWGNMDDVWSMATNAGIAFNVEGNEYYPSHKVSVSDTTPEYKIPDVALDENLLRRTCHIAHVDPDLVLTPDNIEFASQIFSKSLLVTQQITKQQEILQTPLTRYVTTSTLASPILQSKLIERCVRYIKETEPDTQPSDYITKASDYMRVFINGIKVSLPPPDTSTANSQMDLFDKRLEFFEKLADLVVTEDIAQMMQDAGVSLDANTIKSMVKTFYIRNWLRRQGMENDFFDLIYDKEKRQENIKMISDEIKEATETILQLGKRVGKKVETLAKKSDMADGEPGAADFGGNDTFGDDNADDGLGDSGDDNGGLGNDDDLLGGGDSSDNTGGAPEEEENPEGTENQEEDLNNL